LILACSPKINYGVKSFFLDGVPNPMEEVEVIQIDTIGTFLQDSYSTLTQILKEPEFQKHLPYQERKCNDCHNPKGMGKLNTPLKELCFNCHTNFNNTYTAVHGPVASGNCTQCHDPHKSKIKGLLLNEGQDLCFNCHDQNKVVGYKIHESIEDTNCTNCHNPHGGQNKFLLQPKACYECHDNFEEKYKYMHGPVGAGGLCTTCHESHAAKQPNLLKTTGNQLCLECHIKSDIDENKAHVNTKKQSCTSCHNPHGSSQPMLLTKIPLE